MKKSDSNLWQSPAWNNFQKKLGRQTWFFKNKKAHLFAVKHPLILGYSWLDIPRGPIGKKEDYQELIDQLIQKTKGDKIVFIRFMPAEEQQITHKKYKTVLAHSNHQPETTLKLDLTLSEEEILKQMKPKGRYNIRLAIKKEVSITESKDISTFFNLIQETTERNQFWGHSQNYYQTMREELKENAQLLLAKYEGKVIAGGLFIYTKDEAIYYYGASSNQNRNVMAPYLIQWTAILEAQKRGCKQYDFLGVAPENAQKNHPWKGVTNFKKKFGGIFVNYFPAQELVLKPLQYKLIICLKTIKKFFK